MADFGDYILVEVSQNDNGQAPTFGSPVTQRDSGYVIPAAKAHHGPSEGAWSKSTDGQQS
jgi:hypothetical protein